MMTCPVPNLSDIYLGIPDHWETRLELNARLY